MHVFESLLRPVTPSQGAPFYAYSLPAFAESLGVDFTRLPYSIKVLIEALLRGQGHPAFEPSHAQALARWTPEGAKEEEFPFLPARVLLQDFTGVPCVVDLAALRSALLRAGQDPARIEPQIPVDLVIDHSVQLDEAGHADALEANLVREFERNSERYTFLRWGQQAFSKLTVLPPGLGICHQVNMEYLAQCVRAEPDEQGRLIAFPDTLVGTDSHTVMINSMGVLGWGVGGIEAEAAMLGQPIPMLPPHVIGMRLTGRLRPEATPTDLALTVTQRLREKGVVGCFVEFFGPGLDALSLVDRAPVANMAPEYGATMGFFPIDAATLAYLRETGRSAEQVARVEAYCRAQGLWREAGQPEPLYSDVVELDLDTVEPSVAGPRRPQDRIPLADVGAQFEKLLGAPTEKKGFGVPAEQLDKKIETEGHVLTHGAVLIASITSCTNTSNPALLLGAALVAKKALAKGLSVPSHVKTSFAPGSRAAAQYLRKAGLIDSLNRLGFQVAAYGCATCIGNSGPLAESIEDAVRQHELVAAAVLSGNRNFEGRIHPLTRANYLASPPLVVAYALKGTVRGDLVQDPLGTGADGQPVYLRDLWPTPDELTEALSFAADPVLYRAPYADVASLQPRWNALPEQPSAVFAWEPDSTYVREPPFFDAFQTEAGTLADIEGAAALGFFGDFITTDHISPAGSIAKNSPAAVYLRDHGVAERDFNSYGSRRGNHEVMMRGTFANIRLRNRLVAREGGYTLHFPTGDELAIYDAAMRYRAEGTPLVVLAGKMYGAGSSRDWAAKGTALLGVRAVLAESFERIHRSNLVEMGVLPLEFVEGQTAESLGLTGRETFCIRGLDATFTPGQRLEVLATKPDGTVQRFEAKARIDTAVEIDYYRHGGILPYVLRGFMK